MHLPYTPNNILFICIGGIGNLVLLTPALKMLSAQWPSARFHFLLTPTGSRQVVERHPQTGTIVEVRPAVGALLERIFPLRRLKPDLVFSAAGTNPLFCGLIGVLCGAPYRLGESFGFGKWLYNITCPYDHDEHEARANVRIASVIAGTTQGAETCTVWTAEQDQARAAAVMGKPDPHRPVAGIHLGSGPAMAYKRWPSERFVELAKRIVSSHNASIVLFGGSEERGEAQAAAQAIGGGAASYAGQLSVQESYEAMKRCRIFISNDSGPMHLAAAAGCAVVALFGPTRPKNTAPWGEHHAIVSAGIACQPCYDLRTKKVGCLQGTCMRNISVDEVMKQVDRVLKEAAPAPTLFQSQA